MATQLPPQYRSQLEQLLQQVGHLHLLDPTAAAELARDAAAGLFGAQGGRALAPTQAPTTGMHLSPALLSGAEVQLPPGSLATFPPHPPSSGPYEAAAAALAAAAAASGSPGGLSAPGGVGGIGFAGTLPYLLTGSFGYGQGGAYATPPGPGPVAGASSYGSLHGLVDSGAYEGNVAGLAGLAGFSGPVMPAGAEGEAAAASAPPAQAARPLPPLERVGRTVYVSGVSRTVTEVALASALDQCGRVVDCRVCGDASSATRFAFVEFETREGADRALARDGDILADGAPIRVAPSKTAILPVRDRYLPRSEREVERVTRTIYVGNVDRHVGRDALRTFFESACGPVTAVRVLSDSAHATAIAFLEFARADAAHAALACAGTLLGSLPIRVSPSKTPVRPAARGPRRVRAAGKHGAAAGPADADADVADADGGGGRAPHTSLERADDPGLQLQLQLQLQHQYQLQLQHRHQHQHQLRRDEHGLAAATAAGLATDLSSAAADFAVAAATAARSPGVDGGYDGAAAHLSSHSSSGTASRGPPGTEEKAYAGATAQR